jgi:hypothetical protein
MTDDEKVAQRYRELGAEEPPRALDEAILAAARRAAAAGPTPLSVRSSRQRWYAPLATAAVLVLAVAVTVNMRQEQPGIESPAPQAVAPPAEQPASTQELKLKPETSLASVPRQAEKDAVSSRRKEAVAPAAPAAPSAPAPAVREPQPFAADRAAASAGAAAPRADDARGAESSVTGSLARQLEERTSRDAEAAARAPRMAAIQSQAKREQADLLAKNQVDTPERELERIAQLRAQGRHEEADKALAEFRKRQPDYRIPGAMLERVERR